MNLELHLEDVDTGPDTNKSWLPTEPFVFQLPESSPVHGLVVHFKNSPHSSFQLTLHRKSADFAVELKEAIATYRAINIDSIESIECDGVDLSDGYEVANLKLGDVLVVTIASSVSPRATAVPVTAVSLLQSVPSRSHSSN